jgi:ABC-type transport system involved in multi-copper enzyme maturation permease subunit
MSDKTLPSADMILPERGIVYDSDAGTKGALVRGPGAIRTVILMARVTFLEAARRRILWIAAISGVAFLGLFWAGLHSMLQSMSPRVSPVNRMEGIGMMTMMVLYAGSMMTSLISALISCDTLSGEIASGTIHAIATKPVNRWCLVLGKWIGFAGMLTANVLFIEGGTIAIGWLEARHLTPHAAAALSLIWLQSIVLLGVTMACSTRLSALTSGACSLGLYGLAFVGGWIEQFGSLRHIRACVELGVLASLVMPTDALWRRAAFKIQPPLLGAAGVSPFAGTVVPSTAMVVYAAVYAVVAIVIAQILFEKRDL